MTLGQFGYGLHHSRAGVNTSGDEARPPRVGAWAADGTGREADAVSAGDGAVAPIGRLERRPLYELLADRLREHADEHDLRAGAKLPAERVLAGQLGVSRASLRQAIVALEVQGLLEVRHGGGTFLRRDGLQPAPLAEVLDRRRRLPAILDAREALEGTIARLAAERRTPSDVARIETALAELTGDEDTEPAERGDADFHAAITAAAHSPIIARMMAELAPEIALTRHESLDQPGRPARSAAQHRAVAEAVIAGDPVAASEAMLAHLRSVGDVKLLSWIPPEDDEA
jgi:GntR family transcriptional repressor for pyruvate dehydrogenase complex